MARNTGASTDLNQSIRLYYWRRARKNGNPDFLAFIHEREGIGYALREAGATVARTGMRCDLMIDGKLEYRVWRNSRKDVVVTRNGKTLPVSVYAPLMVNDAMKSK